MHNLDAHLWSEGATREVFFALGLAAVGRDQAAVPGPVLIAVLSDLGLSESAARAAILRLRRHGWLSSDRHGRQTYYAPTATIHARQQRFQEHFTTASPPWAGAFHGLIYEVPERQRAYRDRLRRCARLLGYASLRGGLLIAPTDGFLELQSLLSEPPSEAHLLPARIELAPADARRLAHRLWALDALADYYRARVVAVRDAINDAASNPPAGPQALQAFAAATHPIYEAISRDPLLPSELLPDDWPGAELGAALQAAHQTLGPAAVAYVHTLR
jgi:phenylacetic acid degradation operon negative regulatory protein